jgi:hypothetical protein
MGVTQWAADGVALCPNGKAATPRIVSDGASGAIIAWLDTRCQTSGDLYANRVTSWGTHPASRGAAACRAPAEQSLPAMIADGFGGTIIVWADRRNGNYDIYAQRVGSSGAAQWDSNGVALCTAAGDQAYPTLTSDMAGGAFVTWQDRRGSTNDIYAQRVNASGMLEWSTNDGIPLSTAANDQLSPVIIGDDANGAIVIWQHYVPGGGNIFAQRVSSAGAILWNPGGIAMCATSRWRSSPTAVPDSMGGAIVTWRLLVHTSGEALGSAGLSRWGHTMGGERRRIVRSGR